MPGPDSRTAARSSGRAARVVLCTASAVLLAAALAACGGGDSGHAPPALSSTLPGPGPSQVPGIGPTPLSRVGRGLVVLCVGTGASTTLPASVPDVVGLSLQEAARDLGCQGFRPGVYTRVAPADVVTSQSPPAGSPVPAGRIVRLTFGPRH